MLALLAGVYPIVFYISNNWFIFSASQSLSIFGAFSLFTFLLLAIYYLGLTYVLRKLFSNNSQSLIRQIYVFGSILVLIYLLRYPLREIFDNRLYLSSVIILMALGLGWISPKKQILYINSFLLVLCLVSIGNGLYSILNKGESTSLIKGVEDSDQQKVYDQVKFQIKPNVYYIVPDSYPNQKALMEIFELDNTNMYQQLETLGFRIHHFAFSNYMSTLASISATFGMQHHYYQGNIGNFEFLSSREFIVSEKNPVVRLFKTNGYKIHYVHQRDVMFTKGCSIDLCSPNSFWGEFINILIPSKAQRIKPIANAIGRSSSVSLERILNHIDEISALPNKFFTYIHIFSPDHSLTPAQTPKELSSFREEYFKKLHVANARIIKLVDRILTRDPGAFIILNADHGSWGLGNFDLAQMEVFEGIPDNLIALDHLGVLLAIRWPKNDVPGYSRDIRSNVNLFRHIFAYLSQSQNIMTTKVPDTGFLTKGKGKDSLLMKVINDDGKLLEHMIEISPLE